MGAQDQMIADLAKVLRSARSLLRLELNGIYDCACKFDGKGQPILSTLEDSFKPIVRRYKRVLSSIDRALA